MVSSPLLHQGDLEREVGRDRDGEGETQKCRDMERQIQRERERETDGDEVQKGDAGRWADRETQKEMWRDTQTGWGLGGR